MHALVSMLASTGHGALPSAPETAEVLASREALDERLSCLRRLAPPPPARGSPPPPLDPSMEEQERSLPTWQPAAVYFYGDGVGVEGPHSLGGHFNSPDCPVPPHIFIENGGYVSREGVHGWQPSCTLPVSALANDFFERFPSPTLSSLLGDASLPGVVFTTPVINSPLLGDRPVQKTGAGGAGRALAFGDHPFPSWTPANTKRLKSAFDTKQLLGFYREAFPDSALSERSRKTKDFLITKLVDAAPDVAFRALAQAPLGCPPAHEEETDLEEEDAY
jgi:hypothetical protein